MAETNKTELKKMDLEGYEIVTDAIQSLLDTYPGLEEGDKIVFSNLEETSGIAWYPVSGGAIEKEKKSETHRWSILIRGGDMADWICIIRLRLLINLIK